MGLKFPGNWGRRGGGARVPALVLVFDEFAESCEKVFQPIP